MVVSDLPCLFWEAPLTRDDTDDNDVKFAAQ